MKHKVLLTGNNHAIIDDFFLQLSDSFECQNCSSRFDDMESHMKYFQPDVFIYCMNNEPRGAIVQLASLKRSKNMNKCVFAAVADQEDFEDFHRQCTADLELRRPITPAQIKQRILDYMEEMAVKLAESAPKPKAPAAQPAVETSSFYDQLDPTLSLEDALAGIPDVARKHILIVDDDARMLKLLKRYLDDKYDIATAINGKIALKFLQAKSTNLILLDYEMPEENGPAVLEKIRANPVTREIPVIFLTGVSDTKKILQVLSFKPKGYLLKPIDQDKLMVAIKEALG